MCWAVICTWNVPCCTGIRSPWRPAWLAGTARHDGSTWQEQDDKSELLPHSQTPIHTFFRKYFFVAFVKKWYKGTVHLIFSDIIYIVTSPIYNSTHYSFVETKLREIFVIWYISIHCLFPIVDYLNSDLCISAAETM